MLVLNVFLGQELVMNNRSILLAILLLLSPISVAFAAKGFSEKDVRGSYAFSFEGEIVGVGPVAATGMMRSDGQGNIPEAVRTISVNGVPQTETFTCTLEVNPNGTGSAVCPLDAPAPGFPAIETFDFVLEDKGRSFRFVGTTPGIVILGSGLQQ